MSPLVSVVKHSQCSVAKAEVLRINEMMRIIENLAIGKLIKLRPKIGVFYLLNKPKSRKYLAKCLNAFDIVFYMSDWCI